MPGLQDDSHLTQLGYLYLNESNSDVVFNVGNIELPAHQTVLSQRSPIFEELFRESANTTEKREITLIDIPVESAKTFLKFMYLGTVNLNNVGADVVLGVLQLATKYHVTKLEEVTINQLKSACNVNNTCVFLNKAVELEQNQLITICLEQMKPNFYKVFAGESFKQLSVKALTLVLKKAIVFDRNWTEWALFCAVVEWMKANPSEPKHFSELLKRIDLRTFGMDEIATAIYPFDLIDGNELLAIVYELTKNAIHPDRNVEQVGVVTRGVPTFYTKQRHNTSLKHTVGNGDDHIAIDLKRLYMLNFMEMELFEGDKSYWIEVSQDNVNWTRIVDYSKCVCRSVQKLFFKERSLRYIRIHGTAPTNGIFEILRLEASYTKEPFEVDPETGIVIPSHNVALAEKNAATIQGGNGGAIINGISTEIYHTYSFTGNSIVVQLPQPYLLANMNLLLDKLETYSYNVAISADKIHWTTVLEETRKVTSWQYIQWSRQPVVFFKFTGTYSSGASLLIHHMESPAQIQAQFCRK